MSNFKEFSDQLEWNIIGTENDKQAELQLENTNFKENLSNKKLTVDYGYFGNDSLPLFIPKYIESFPTITPTPTAIYNNTRTINSTDYAIRITNVNTNDTYVRFIHWIPEMQVVAPLTPPQNQQQMYMNKYYWGKSTTHFAQVVSNDCAILAQSIPALNLGQVCQIIVGANSFSFIINKDFANGTLGEFTIEFSKELNKLFRFQSTYTDEYFERLIFGGAVLSTVTYGGQSCNVCNGLGWSNKWFPFDQLFITSDLNLKKIQNQSNLVQNSTNFYTTNYKNVILEFNILNQNPNQIYPYFEYVTDSDNTKFVFFENDVDLRESYTIKIYLRNIVYNIIMPYTLSKNEYINLKLRYFTAK